VSGSISVRRSGSDHDGLALTRSPTFSTHLAGKAQIIALIFVAELATEVKKPHYMMGGEMPTIIYPPIDFSNVSPETLKVKRSRELNNGRLAMIAIMSFISEYNIPGSVPILSGIDAF